MSHGRRRHAGVDRQIGLDSSDPLAPVHPGEMLAEEFLEPLGPGGGGASAPYVVVWEFQARPGREAEFERAYGPQGVWAEMFARAPGFRGVQLLRCADRPGRYLTIDCWESKAAFEDFRARFGAAYDTLDRKLEGLAEFEKRIGAFTARPLGSPSK